MNGGGVSVTKTKKRKRPSNSRLCTGTSEAKSTRKIESDKERRLGEDLAHGHGLWNDVPIYSDATDCRIRDQQVYYYKEGHGRAFGG